MLVCQRRMHRRPMIDTVLECAHFGIEPRKRHLFGDAGPLIEKVLPVLDRPAVVTSPQYAA